MHSTQQIWARGTLATAIATGWPGCVIERIAIAAARVVLVQKVENFLLESPSDW